MPVHVLGIRHHGPGSARAVLRALETLRPSRVLIEGPPDADDLIPLVAVPGMTPPVALLVYRPDQTARCIYYPLAAFSPEWVALRWAVEHGVPVRFMDLPQRHRFALDEAALAEAEAALLPVDAPSEANTETAADEPSSPALSEPRESEALEEPEGLDDWRLRTDPIGVLAALAGFEDGERWWEHVVEHRGGDLGAFDAVHDAMAALREAALSGNAHGDASRDHLREAWMRRTIRETVAEAGDGPVAVICGAWHAPVLLESMLSPTRRDDTRLLTGLPKVKVSATWVPWSTERLTRDAGYGAGIRSPGWYQHLWEFGADADGNHVVERWFVTIAQVLRELDLDCSSAHVIEASRLAVALAALRDHPHADLHDLDEAMEAVFPLDATLALALARRVHVGHGIGAVPPEIPVVPLVADLRAQQKRLRLAPEALERVLELDLRRDLDRDRSTLLHRLRLVGMPWGTPEAARGKGTFKEVWRLAWNPEWEIRLIELAAFGNTVASATATRLDALCRELTTPAELTALLDSALLAGLPTAVSSILARLDVVGATADVDALLVALPALIGTLRYGDVRGTDSGLLRTATTSLVPRVVAGLPNAASALADDAARALAAGIASVDACLPAWASAMVLSDGPPADSPEAGEGGTSLLLPWRESLLRIASRSDGGVHGFLRGRCTRLLFDAQALTRDALASRLALATSPGTEPEDAAAWIEGLLSGSGLIIIHDPELLRLLDDWLCGIADARFDALAPVLRRTFSGYPAPERRQIGVLLAAPTVEARGPEAPSAVDTERARLVVPLLLRLFGTGGTPPAEEPR